MTKEKLNKLYEKSKKITDIMIELGKNEYKNYKLKISLYETFLSLDDTFITNTLKSVYIDENLNNFIPKTKIEVMEKFETDIDSHLFEDLEKEWSHFIGSEDNG